MKEYTPAPSTIYGICRCHSMKQLNLSVRLSSSAQTLPHHSRPGRFRLHSSAAPGESLAVPLPMGGLAYGMLGLGCGRPFPSEKGKEASGISEVQRTRSIERQTRWRCGIGSGVSSLVAGQTRVAEKMRTLSEAMFSEHFTIILRACYILSRL